MGKDLKVYKSGKVLDFPGKTLANIPADLVGCPALEYEYFGGYGKVDSKNCFRWAIVAASLSRSLGLLDSRGEKRDLPLSSDLEERIFETLSNYRDWTHYDEIQSKKELENLKTRLTNLEASRNEARSETAVLDKQLSDIKYILCDVFDLNEKGGSGSRKKVRALLEKLGITACGECGNARCTCGE